MNLGETSQAIGTKVLSCLAHRVRRHFESLRMEMGRGEGERSHHAVTVRIYYTVEITHLLDGSSFIRKGIQHRLPKSLRDRDHAAGLR
jgi:hypothetical protein